MVLWSDSLREGWSFGGLCRENRGSDQVFGITAAHCLENPIPEITAVTVRSALEINASFLCISRYTTLSTEKVYQKSSKERGTLAVWTVHIFTIPTWAIIQRSRYRYWEREVVTIHKSGGLMKTGILKRHDKALVRAGYACFGLDRGCLARFDFSIFQCNKTYLWVQRITLMIRLHH